MNPAIPLRGWLGAVLAASLLCACASIDKDPRIEKAEALQAEGFWEAAIAELEGAATERDGSHRYRAALSDARARAALQLLVQAETHRQAGRYDDARQVYERLLRMQVGEQRASFGLQQVETDRRHAAGFENAERALRKGDYDAAEEPVKRILVESPRNARALALLRRIEERRPRASVPVLRAPALRTPITLEFRDANLKMILDIVAKASGINFVLDKDIRADTKASIFVRNTTIEEAIESLLTTNQLAKKVLSETSVLVYPNTPQKAKDYQDLLIRNFFLASADAKQMMNLLRTILKTRDVFIDEKRNLLVIRDTPESVRLAERLIAAHDQAEPEVVLEVEVLEISRSKTRDLGIEFPDTISFGVVDPIVLRALRRATSGDVNVSGLNPFATLKLSQLLADANLLSNPRIRVRNREKAKIHVGDRVPVLASSFIATTGGTAQNVNYLDVGLKLEVEPQVLDDEVVIKVSLEVSALGAAVPLLAGSTYNIIGTRNASTTLTLKDGETQVLAGLITDNDRDSARKLPGLAELPVLGRLFSSNRAVGEKSEIILSITPRIVRRMERPEAALAEFWSGPESNVRSAVSVPGAPAAPAAPPKPAPRVGGVFAPFQSGVPGSTGVTIVPGIGTVPTMPATTPAAPAATPVTPAAAPATGTGTAKPAPVPATPTPPLFFSPPPGVGTQ